MITILSSIVNTIGGVCVGGGGGGGVMNRAFIRAPIFVKKMAMVLI
jgi:hypothetical protein